MAVYIALLRSVNVGGRSLPSADLRALFEGMGFAAVRTYIQSGNVLFEAAASPEALRPTIEQTLAAQLGFEVPVVLRTPAELRQVVAANPFSDRGAEPKHVHVTFLAAAPDPAGTERLARDAQRHLPDECRLVGSEVYLHCPNGYGQTKLTPGFIESRLKVATTTRNWNTVVKLLELAGG